MLHCVLSGPCACSFCILSSIVICRGRRGTRLSLLPLGVSVLPGRRDLRLIVEENHTAGLWHGGWPLPYAGATVQGLRRPAQGWCGGSERMRRVRGGLLRGAEGQRGRAGKIQLLYTKIQVFCIANLVDFHRHVRHVRHVTYQIRVQSRLVLRVYSEQAPPQIIESTKPKTIVARAKTVAQLSSNSREHKFRKP